jgi:competence protein ComFB
VNIAAHYSIEHLDNRGMRRVLERVGAYLDEHPGFCRCEQCVLDLLAYTLNHVSPIYRSSLLGPLTGSDPVEKKLNIEIDIALEEGALRIARNPGHMEDDEARERPARG